MKFSNGIHTKFNNQVCCHSHLPFMYSFQGIQRIGTTRGRYESWLVCGYYYSGFISLP